VKKAEGTYRCHQANQYEHYRSPKSRGEKKSRGGIGILLKEITKNFPFLVREVNM
jgi:hypothetical protein